MLKPRHTFPHHWISLLEAADLIGGRLYSVTWKSYRAARKHERDAVRHFLHEALGSREIEALAHDGTDPFRLASHHLRDPSFGIDVLNSTVEGNALGRPYRCEIHRPDLERFLAATLSASADADQQALEWLTSELRNDTKLLKTRKQLLEEAKKLFRISQNAFDRIWKDATTAAGSRHSRPGRRQKIKLP